MLTGLNSNTATNLQLGAGALLKSAYVDASSLSGSNVLTATNGGITFRAVPEFFTPTVDGMFDNVKGGGRRIVRWTVTASFTGVQMSEEVLLKALGCADKDTTTGIITGRHEIKAADYSDLYIVGEKGDGSIIEIKIANSLNESGLDLSTANNGNGGLSFTINGNYDITDLETPPFEIREIAGV